MGLCGEAFLVFAVSLAGLLSNRTPDTVSILPGRANAFEFEDPDLALMGAMRRNHLFGVIGGAAATGGLGRVLGECHELALVLIQRTGGLSVLRPALWSTDSEIPLPLLFQRITQARAQGQKLLLIWNDSEFVEEEDLFSAVGG